MRCCASASSGRSRSPWASRCRRRRRLAAAQGEDAGQAARARPRAAPARRPGRRVALGRIATRPPPATTCTRRSSRLGVRSTRSASRAAATWSCTKDVIALCPDDPVRIDAIAFEELAAATAREQRDPAAYRDALESYDGELLPEDRYEEWTASRRDVVHELRLALGIELAELEAPDDPAAAIDRLRSVLTDEPLHEPAHRALMRLYADGGRRQEALAQFQQLEARPAARVRGRARRRDPPPLPRDPHPQPGREPDPHPPRTRRRRGRRARSSPAADQLHRPRARAGRGRGAAAQLAAAHPDRGRRLRQDEARAGAGRAAAGGVRRRRLAGRAGGARRARADRARGRPGAGHATRLRPRPGGRARRAHRRAPAAAPARQLRAPGRAGRASGRGAAAHTAPASPCWRPAASRCASPAR